MTKICARPGCGKEFIPRTWNAVCCPDCRVAHRLDKQRERGRRLYEAKRVRPPATIICADCQAEVPYSRGRELCGDCADKRVLKRASEQAKRKSEQRRAELAAHKVERVTKKAELEPVKQLAPDERIEISLAAGDDLQERRKLWQREYYKRNQDKVRSAQRELHQRMREKELEVPTLRGKTAFTQSDILHESNLERAAEIINGVIVGRYKYVPCQ